MSLSFSPAARSTRSASARRDRKRVALRRTPEALEAFEARQMMTVGLIAAGTATLTTPNFFNESLSNNIGFTAATPVLSADGTQVVFGFDNTKGTGPVTVDIATYLDQGTTAPVALSTEVLEGVTAYPIAKGAALTVSIPIHDSVQYDAFIQSYGSPAMPGTNVIPKLSSVFDSPAYNMFAAPAVDAGYNININTGAVGFIPASPTATVPAGTLGTLVSVTQTTGPNGPNAGPNDLAPSSISGVATVLVNGVATPLANQTITLTGTVGALTGTPTGYTTTATTNGGGAYTLNIPYADLPLTGATVSTTLPTGDTLVSATPGIIDGSTLGTGVLTPGASGTTPAESITGIAVNFGGLAGTGYNFQFAKPATVAPGSVAGTVYLDATGNGLAPDGTAPGDSTFGPGVPITLSNAAGTVLYSTSTLANGTYSFPNVAPGTYILSESPPGGYQQTGAVAGTLVVGSGSALTGENFTLLPTCNSSAMTGLTFTDLSSAGTQTYTSLGGNTNEGDVVTANFTNSGKTPFTVTLVSYTATANMDLTQQSVFQVSTQTVAPGATAHLTVQIPNSYYQIDFVCGNAITKFNPAANDTYHGENRFYTSDNDGYEVAPGTSLAPTFAGLSGEVFVDKNLNGVFNAGAGDTGIGGVTVQLTGTDAQGKTVNLTRVTAADGTYNFAGLQPGTYKVSEVVPSGYVATKSAIGTGSSSTATTSTPTTISTISLSGGNAASQYNFGDTLAGCQLGKGQVASACFFASCNGQNLLKSLNGGWGSTGLSSWLATTLPNLFGASGWGDNLTGKTNAQVASFAAGLVGCNGVNPVAETLAVALSVYVTDSSLAGGNYATSYGFTVGAGGTGACTINACTYFSQWGGPTGTITIDQFLMFANANSSNGALGGSDGNLAWLLNEASEAIIWTGDINNDSWCWF